MSNDGRRLAFSSKANWDSSASTGGVTQVFTYDVHDMGIRQVTGREGIGFGGRATLSADGTILAFEAGGIWVFELDTGLEREVVGQDALPCCPLLSGDGQKAAFDATIDQDPTVGNYDLNSEVLIADLVDDSFTQVTDSYSDGGQGIHAIDDVGRVVLLTGSQTLIPLDLSPPVVRMIRRADSNNPPEVHAPSTVHADEGTPTIISIHGTDVESGPISLYVEFADRAPRLRDFSSTLGSTGDRSAELTLTPRYNYAGTYALRAAAFDEGGASAVGTITLVVEDTLQEGDADCNGVVNATDLDALLRGLFDSGLRGRCVLADANDDGRINAADLPALLSKLAR